MTVVWFSLIDGRWVSCCQCGFQTEPRITLEAAGREFDLHMAEKFPKGSERVPCVACGPESAGATDVKLSNTTPKYRYFWAPSGEFASQCHSLGYFGFDTVKQALSVNNVYPTAYRLFRVAIGPDGKTESWEQISIGPTAAAPAEPSTDARKERERGDL